MKSILAMCGLVALVVALGIWQFGFFSNVKEHIKRETAVARAQAVVRNMEERAASLTDRARQLRIEARELEKPIEREEQQTAKTKQAVVTLAQAARDAGLPKPSAAAPDDLKKTMAFAGRTLSAAEIYRTLERWQSDVRASEDRLQATRGMIDRIRITADQLEQKQSQYVAQVEQTSALLKRLELQRDLAAMDKELAELGASAAGNPAGELKGILETLQKQIDEYEATSEVLAAEPAADQPLTPDQVLAGQGEEVTVRQELDALWGNE